MIAAIALGEFNRRRALVLAMRRNRQITEDRGIDLLTPWASMVLRTGGVPKGAEADLADLEESFAPAAARLCLAELLCTRAQIARTLESSCSRALARVNSNQADHAEAASLFNQQRLAIHFGAQLLPKAQPKPLAIERFAA